MTEATASPATTYIPTGHPVRRFVVLLAALAVLAAGLWWSGALAPRVVRLGGYASVFDAATTTGHVTVAIRNRGPVAVRVDGLGIRGDGYTLVGAEVAVPDSDPDASPDPGLQPFRSFDLGPGEIAEVMVRFESVCGDAASAVEVRTRTFAGRSHTDAFDTGTPNPQPCRAEG